MVKNKGKIVAKAPPESERSEPAEAGQEGTTCHGALLVKVTLYRCGTCGLTQGKP